MEKPASSSNTPPAVKKSPYHEEPKALTAKQFQQVREAALEILKNNTKEEALKIFTEGLDQEKEVAESEEGGVNINSSVGSWDGYDDDYDYDISEDDSNLYRTDDEGSFCYDDDYDISGDSSLSSTDDDEIEIPVPKPLSGKRDVVSAPFEIPVPKTLSGKRDVVSAPF